MHRVASQTLLAGADVGACDMLMNNGKVVKLVMWDITEGANIPTVQMLLSVVGMNFLCSLVSLLYCRL